MSWCSEDKIYFDIQSAAAAKIANHSRAAVKHSVGTVSEERVGNGALVVQGIASL